MYEYMIADIICVARVCVKIYGLLLQLRDSQSYCTDNQCLQEREFVLTVVAYVRLTAIH